MNKPKYTEDDYDGAMHEVGELVRVLYEIVEKGRDPNTAREWLHLNFKREILRITNER